VLYFRVEVLATPSRKLNLISTALSKVQYGPRCQLVNAVRTAQLALKNRPNKNQHQRIILFVGSPLEEKKDALVKLGKDLKKNSIAVDVINFGTENASNGNTEKLEAFVSAANSSDNSHLLNIPPGPHVMSNLVITSEIILPRSAGAGSASNIGAGANQAAPVRVGGNSVDEDNDRDFQMALRMSMEDTRQKQQEKANAPKSEDKKSEAPKAAASEPKAATRPAAKEDEEDDEDEDMDDMDEEEMARALALSMAPKETTPAPVAVNLASASVPMDTDVPSAAVHQAEGDQDLNLDALEDRDFLSSILGVAANEGDVDDLLNKLNDGAEKSGKKDEKKN